MEGRVGRLQPVAVELDVIKQQQDELRPLAKEYRDYSITIDKVSCRVMSFYDISCKVIILIKSVQEKDVLFFFWFPSSFLAVISRIDWNNVLNLA